MKQSVEAQLQVISELEIEMSTCISLRAQREREVSEAKNLLEGIKTKTSILEDRLKQEYALLSKVLREKQWK